MTILAEVVDAVIGGDTHRDTHTLGDWSFSGWVWGLGGRGSHFGCSGVEIRVPRTVRFWTGCTGLRTSR